MSSLVFYHYYYLLGLSIILNLDIAYFKFNNYINYIIENLKKKRSVLKGKITHINNILKPKLVSSEIEIEELDVYAVQIDEIRVEHINIHTENK